MTGGAAHTAGPTARSLLAQVGVMMMVSVGVVKGLDIDRRGHVAGVVLGPGGDAGYEGGEGVAGEEPSHSSHDRTRTDQMSCWNGVVRPVSGCCPQGAELNSGQHAAQDRDTEQ